MDVLVIYQFCTFGGVERLLLNRASAFKKHHLNVVIHIGYLSDNGALNSFKNYIFKNHLQEIIKPFLISKISTINNSHFDLTLLIDTPKIVDRLSSSHNLFIECHTPYVENRQYLSNLPDTIRGVIVPSVAFKTIIQEEYPNLKLPIVIPNPIPEEFYIQDINSTHFLKRPLVYVARLDEIKNFSEAVEIFDLIKIRTDIIFIVIGEGSTEENIFSRFRRLGLIENSILRDTIEFSQVSRLIGMVRKSNVIFISPSKGESFGLSAAEFICGGVPVLLTSIPAHRSLVDDNEQFLYEPGDISSAKMKIEYTLENWVGMSNKILKLGEKFRDNHFIDSWNNFIKEFDI